MPPPRGRIRSRSTVQAAPLILDLQRATHTVGMILESRLSAIPASQGEAHVLALLADRAEHSVGDLQRGLRHRPSTLSGILDRLESRRLVRRSINAADRRSFLIALTPAGRRAADAVIAVLSQLEDTVRAGATARDLSGFRAVTALLAGAAGG